MSANTEDLRRAIATAIADVDHTTDDMAAAELDAAYLEHADAVLAVPQIRDALAMAAFVASIPRSEWEAITDALRQIHDVVVNERPEITDLLALLIKEEAR